MDQNNTKGNISIGLGKPPGSQIQCFSTYSNWEKSLKWEKFNFSHFRKGFGPIPDKEHGRNQHFLIC